MSNKFQQALGIVSALASLLPAIGTAVQSAESALGPGNGSAKLAVVESTIQAAYSTVQGIEVAWADLQPAVAATVGALVTFYNTVKAFSHAGKAAAAMPAAG
jgi:hypothetical protein